MQTRPSSFAALALCLITSIAGAGEAVTYAVNGQSYEGYYSAAQNSRGLVLLIHDWDGLTAYEVRRAEMLVEQGYSVFAADLFGAGVRPTELTDKQQHTGELYKDRAKMRALMNGAISTARGLGAQGEAVAIGYCFGGAAVLELARSGKSLQGFATFHGGLATPDGQDYSATSGKLMIYHGTADSAISMQQFAALADQLEESGVAHEMVTYSATPHAFTNFSSPSYRKEADTKSWASFLEFLDETL